MNMYVLIKKKNKTNSTKKVVKWGEGKDGLKMMMPFMAAPN